MLGFSHARTTFVQSFIRIDRSFVFIDSFAQRNRLDSSQPSNCPSILRLLVLGNLRREPRFRTSKYSDLQCSLRFCCPLEPSIAGLWRKGFGQDYCTTSPARRCSASSSCVTARRDWVPTCTFCARDHRLNCWNGKLMLLGDSNIPVTTHTTPVVVHDIALQLRLQLFVAALRSTHQFWGT